MTAGDARRAARLTEAHEIEDACAQMLAAVAATSTGDTDMVWSNALLPQLERLGTVEAVLAGVAAVGGPAAAVAAFSAVDRLRAGGVRLPDVVATLAQPWSVRDTQALIDDSGRRIVLSACFDRHDRSDAVFLLLDPDCGVVVRVVFLPATELPTLLAEVCEAIGKEGVELRAHQIGAAEFRWATEVALDAREFHERDATGPVENQRPGEYATQALLVRAKLRGLPNSLEPKPDHREAHSSDGLLELIQDFRRIEAMGREKNPTVSTTHRPRSRTAPILLLRVDIRDARPPIWRRLAVPADISLRDLHLVLQAAFGWQDTHRHVFDTAFGEFGADGPESVVENENSVTLEQVAVVRRKIHYRYDVGDTWELVIKIENAQKPKSFATYPTCTGGRLAAPPEDCGGLSGYHHLLAVLADPDHPEHSDSLRRLGLASVKDLRPRAFDKQAINRELGRLRKPRRSTAPRPAR
ncbi:plasmid pRiA4b ORF-3 family protein [Nocardia stercoris]|uniref:plasmid pRiA4b ORF-3 family protein n=1 Tax=Nocardia stercoris TaxID=2483361 RepID=UPI00131A1C8B|nr:plasmid pRiA4b ORF-3 family protein [Nocardia stercoris]